MRSNSYFYVIFVYIVISRKFHRDCFRFCTRFCSLKVQNLVLRIDLVNRPTAVYSRAYGNQTYKHTAPSILVVFQLIKTWRFNLVNESKVLIITNWHESLNLSNFDLWLIFSKLFYHLVSRTLKTAKWGHETFWKGAVSEPNISSYICIRWLVEN